MKIMKIASQILTIFEAYLRLALCIIAVLYPSQQTVQIDTL